MATQTKFKKIGEGYQSIIYFKNYNIIILILLYFPLLILLKSYNTYLFFAILVILEF